MTGKRPYSLGEAYPREGFVQRVIERYFTERGFQLARGDQADLVCVHRSTGERWLVEAKGQTSDVGLDFRSGLGQLVTRMTEVGALYGLAMPDTPQFARMRREVAERVRTSLELHWLIVGEDGAVRVVPPGVVDFEQGA